MSSFVHKRNQQIDKLFDLKRQIKKIRKEGTHSIRRVPTPEIERKN
jgi:hypothetical protein